jgi:hypothetical protein
MACSILALGVGGENIPLSRCSNKNPTSSTLQPAYSLGHWVEYAPHRIDQDSTV